MNQNFLHRFKKIIELKAEGKNINRFLKRMMKHQVELLKISYVNPNCVRFLIYQKDLEQVNQMKTIYEIEIVKVHGLLKFKQVIKQNTILLLFLLVGYCCLLLLSKMIFSVEVIHTDKELRTLLLNELEEEGISKYHFKKDYHELNKIKGNILEKHKDRIEWLEIEEHGTSYSIRVEERLLNKLEPDGTYQDIVASKSAIIKLIDAKNGEIIKNKLDYVKKGDTIISGNITLNEDIKDVVQAKGTVYGEVWYKVSVEYPLHYEETLKTGNEKKVLSFRFLSHTLELFNFNAYKDAEVESSTLLKSNLLPFSFTLDKQKEVNIINEDYNVEEATKQALTKVREKIESTLNENEYILEIKKLKVEENNSTIILEVFVSVYEDITAVKEITIETEPEIVE